MKFLLGFIPTFSSVIFVAFLLQTVSCASVISNTLSRETVQDLLTEATEGQDLNDNQNQNQTRVNRMGEGEITLISFLQQSVKKYGEKKVAASVYELAQKSLYDLTWMLAGDLEPWLILDLYKMYNTASADPQVLSVYERFRAGKVNRTIVPEVFALDKKYNQFDWWIRVRGRMLNSVDKYIAGNLKITNPPPKVEFTPDGRPVIAGKPEAVIAQETTTTTTSSTTTSDNDEDPDDPDDEDNEDSDLLDLYENQK